MAKRQCQGVIVRLFTELKRRNVLRMAALYIAAAWLCVEVAGALIDLSVLPGTMGPWVVVLLAIGFPIALIVSWFFDVTPEGVVRDSEVTEGQPVLAAGGRRTDFIIIAMLAAAIILLLVWEPPASGDEGLTVLPFESMTGPDEAGFSEGVSIELQSLLSRLRKFKVKKPPEASIRAGFSDIPTLARELGVRWVLQGSVRRAKNRVRIAVELIDADDDAAIAWSNVFDRELSVDNLFDIQAEIARLITSELRQSLGEYEEQLLSAPPTQNTEAYNAYLLGRQRLTDRRVDWLEDAVEQFALAIELDPDFGEAYAGFVEACGLYRMFGGGKHERCLVGMLDLAYKAVQLAPESGEAWINLGSSIQSHMWGLIFQQEGDGEKVKALVASDRFKELTAEAEAAFQKGLELDPGFSIGYMRYAQFLVHKSMWYGTWIEAWHDGAWSKVIEKGLEVDPLSIPLHYTMFYPDYAKTREKSLWHARRIIEIAPDSPRGYERLGENLWWYFGRADEMVRLASKAAVLDPRHGPYLWHNALAYTALGDFEMALAYFVPARKLGTKDFWLDVPEALALLYAGRTDEAIERFELLQDYREEKLHIPLNFLTGVDIKAGRPDKALSRYRQHKPECFDDPESDNFQSSCPILGFMRVLQAVADEERLQRILSWEADYREKHPLATQRANEMEYYPWLLYDVRLDAIAGRHEQALSVLEDLVEKGFRGRGYRELMWRFFAYYDISVDSIRDHPRFRAAIAVIEADMAAQLENVRAMQRRGEVPTLEQVQAMAASAEQQSGSDGE